jgi:hypothetical protein
LGGLVTRTLAISVFSLLALLGFTAAASAQQTDHLACVSVKDTPPVDGSIPVTISEVIDDTFTDCVIKKVRLTSLCVRVAKDGADDPIAGQSAAEAYGCYKVKCDGAADGSVGVADPFGSRLVERRGGIRTLCTPVELPPAIP